MDKYAENLFQQGVEYLQKENFNEAENCFDGNVTC